jgi:hypothetical protein
MLRPSKYFDGVHFATFVSVPRRSYQMDWMNQIGGLLQQYTGATQPPNSVDDDFDHVTRHAPPNALAGGLAGAFRSSQTPPFGSMVAQMFAQSSGMQRASLVNTLLAAAGPAVLSQLANRGSAPAPVANALQSGRTQLTAEEAAQMPAQFVEEVATHAEQENPSVIDQISDFYSQQPQLVKALGGAALVVLLAKMANQR